MRYKKKYNRLFVGDLYYWDLDFLKDSDNMTSELDIKYNKNLSDKIFMGEIKKERLLDYIKDHIWTGYGNLGTVLNELGLSKLTKRNMYRFLSLIRSTKRRLEETELMLKDSISNIQP